MPETTRNLEWLNHNAQRNYPLADTASGVDTTGTFTIPDDFIVGLDLPVHIADGVIPSNFFVYDIGVFASGYIITIGLRTGPTTTVPVATASISASTHTQYQTYALGGIGPYSDTVGKITIGELVSVSRQPAGSWRFTFDAGRLDPDVIRPIIRTVSTLYAVNNGQRSLPLHDIVELRAGTNCQLATIVAPGSDPVIVVNFIQGEGSIDECICDGDVIPSRPITRINGKAGTPDGNFTLLGSDCIVFTEIENGLFLSNPCTEPCAGCAELEAITRDLERLNQEKTAVQIFAQQLGVSVNTMDIIVLGSKLNDQSCVTC